MNKHIRFSKKNKFHKPDSYATLMALCVVAGLGSVVIGSLAHCPTGALIGTVASGWGLSSAYNAYQATQRGRK